MAFSEFEAWYMARALELAQRGEGHVEPNPLVGCTIVAGDQIVGEGWHQRFGGPHAEIEALQVAGDRAAGATMYVTLEPCCHSGKTPPCTQAILQAGVRRVVAAMRDPFPAVNGGGVEQLQAGGVEVDLGLLENDARKLNAPYLKLVETGRPWIIAKWAMTLDGKIATRTGASRWISNETSRAVVHKLRGRMDAVMVGSGTALADDPLLLPQTPGPRVPTRVVVDSKAMLPSTSQLVRTSRQSPVLVAVGPEATETNIDRLRAAGCEVFLAGGHDHPARLDQLLIELGRRRMTNVLVEGGGKLLGSLFDAGQIDDVRVFVAPRLIGGAQAPGPLAGFGAALMTDATVLDDVRMESLGQDIYLQGRVKRLQGDQ